HESAGRIARNSQHAHALARGSAASGAAPAAGAWSGSAILCGGPRKIRAPIQPTTRTPPGDAQEKALPLIGGEGVEIIQNTSGITMYELCRDRVGPWAAIFGSIVLFSLAAASIFRCAGRIRIHTFAAMIVPTIAPMCV